MLPRSLNNKKTQARKVFPMMKDWLNWMNIGVTVAITLLLTGILFLMSTNTIRVNVPEESKNKNQSPISPFEQPPEAYQTIGEPILQLKSVPIGLQLPDLRKTLVYYGKNNRPDADPNSTMMHFGFVGNKAFTGILPKTPTYIIYDKRQSPPRYEFSPENKETSLWIEAQPEGNNATIDVKMKNDLGEIITTPQAYAVFSLAEKPLTRADSTAWEINRLRVDGTLLTRQKAKWTGIDKFIDRHGGDEFGHLLGKQRIDFEDGEGSYSVYVHNGDVLVWDDKRWANAIPGPNTLGKPLLVVKKIEDRLMSFDLWDNEGKSKITLNLLKTTEPPPQITALQGFKYVGSRTRSQFVFELNKERITLSPLDWLLYIDKGWKKLSTVEDIDAYVEHKITGLLFIFDGIEKRDDHQLLIGTLFNKSGSDFVHVEMVMETGSNLAPSASPGATSPSGTSPGKKGDPKKEAREDKNASLELHPHTKEDIREYQNPLR